MSFLAPLFLIGGAAVALPVIFHLIRRTTKERTVFSSLMFLMPTPPRLTRRSRLEHLLLLALRCLALCLLAMGFARPFFKHVVTPKTSSQAAKRIIVLVDSSASMRRANLWSDARDRVDSVLRKAQPADQVALFTFDRELHPLVSFEEWDSTSVAARASFTMRKLGETSPSWFSTHLGHALISAAETLSDTEGKSTTGPRQIVLVSDLQEGSRLDQLQGYEWPKGVELSVEPLKARSPNNASVQLVTDLNETERKADASVRVRVSNAGDSKREQFKIGWSSAGTGTFMGTPIDIYVPPGQSRIVSVAAPAGTTADRIILRGDDEDFDNTVFAVAPEAAHTTVLYFGNDSEQDTKAPLYFLKRAFQDTRRQVVEVVSHKPNSPVTTSAAQSTALFVVTDPVNDQIADALRQEALSGKTILFVLKNEASAAPLARVLDVSNLTLQEVTPKNYAMLGEIDFRHPLFAPFADPRFSDFTKIHFWKYRRLSAGAIQNARAVATFDNGDPALMEVPLGKGRALILASGWEPDESQLALSTKFVPLLYSALEYGGAAPPAPVQYFAGDTISLAALGASGKTVSEIQAPDGSRISLGAGETNFTATIAPGIYTLGSTVPARRFAVNVDAAESRTAPMPLDEFERLGAPVAHPSTSEAREVQLKTQLQNAELENRQKLWRWFIIATLVVLLFETWLAGRTARRVTMQGGASA